LFFKRLIMSKNTTTTNGTVTTDGIKIDFNRIWGYDPAPESTDHIRLQKKYNLFIGGQFVKPRSGKYFKTINPANEKIIAEVADADEADVDAAVKSARKAFGPWSKLDA